MPTGRETDPPIITKIDALIATLALSTTSLFVVFYTTIAYARDLATPEKIMNKKDVGLTLLDRDMKPYFTFYGAKNKNFIPIDQTPLNIRNAVIAIEDKDFYTHSGLSIKSIFRSAFSNLREGELAYGGSTLTQQLVKNTLLNNQKNFMRKFQEAVLAYEIEKKYNKEKILEMYLNSVYFGKSAYGIDEAAKSYFGKAPQELTLAEAAFLTGVLPTPSKFTTPEVSGANGRRDLVLEKMYEQKYISLSELEEAKKFELAFSKNGNGLSFAAPHFAEMVRQQLVQEYGEEYIANSGFRVRTTIDLQRQDFAQKAVAQHVAKLRRSNATNGAAVVLDPKTGEILALVGSVDWSDNIFGKVNITTSLRQPGSSFKPVVYAGAFEQRIITPATVLKDEPITYKLPQPYSPKDYDNKFRGHVLARRALANSLNIPAVEVGVKMGVPNIISTADSLGISTFQDSSRFGPAIALGAGEVKLLELTGAYAAFANNGEYNSPTGILEVFDKYNNNIYSYFPSPRFAVSPETSFLISSILSDNKARAEVFGSVLTISRPAAVKTGTSQDYRDSWTVGYTPSLAVGVWVGNNDNKRMSNVAGALGAAPIWKALMEEYLAGTPRENFSPPGGVLALRVCSNNGLVLKSPGSSGVGYSEYFIKGTEPTSACILPKPSPPPVLASSPSQESAPQPQNVGGPASVGQVPVSQVVN
ncbi:MAG: hypothetical protein A3D24_05110 [Candidatus Blackburnbacteria bacterium RIFCSPHIGHO2_02_FULL_39_13]|uniref:Uncharacterized protein n=1 Tax=Candidatus Blackburnbacteria bacterium RIFCSPLOWO2_01_FULL_40_20 TaxID=1797519 RepID=A0A1G1VBS8_9BACT|nr:MAG: penicillin-binding protein, 1A family, nonfunctional [Microgenomates group bacterium GW2011_GWA2_39_19]OGY09585.1 MAG: hypothetical protein A3D24_05110 [Candidatus Blackburnbacteria bacterium RIFCSPHIGHO2_02_FULL_39_13]OGY12849.1 MAG: hypothetical protein A3A77_03065 [Candidatus Blackburnbacteria bacterium RIFCSPLOWO2_01_FULL_40_20]